MRVLIDELTGAPLDGEVDDQRLRRLYAPPSLPWLRVNMVSSLDGSATGGSGKSGDINNPGDKRVFDTLRAQADAIVVGAGTARSEGYGPADVPIVLVSRRGQVPEGLRDAPEGRVLLVTRGQAEELSASRQALGGAQVIVAGDDEVDLAAMRQELLARGFRSLLGEGGPSLLADLLAAGVVDEMCVSVVPRLLAGDHPRIAVGQDADVALELGVLVEQSGTLMGRWLTVR